MKTKNSIILIIGLLILFATCSAYKTIRLQDRDVTIPNRVTFEKKVNVELKLDEELITAIEDDRKSIYLSFKSLDSLYVSLGNRYNSVGDGKRYEIDPNYEIANYIIIFDAQNQKLWKMVKKTKSLFITMIAESPGFDISVSYDVQISDHLVLNLDQQEEVFTNSRKYLRAKVTARASHLKEKLRFFFLGERMSRRGVKMIGYGNYKSELPNEHTNDFTFARLEDYELGHVLNKGDKNFCLKNSCIYSFFIEFENVLSLRAGVINYDKIERIKPDQTVFDYISRDERTGERVYKLPAVVLSTYVISLKVLEGEANLYANPGFGDVSPQNSMFKNEGKGMKRLVLESWKLKAMKLKEDSVRFFLLKKSIFLLKFSLIQKLVIKLVSKSLRMMINLLCNLGSQKLGLLKVMKFVDIL